MRYYLLCIRLLSGFGGYCFKTRADGTLDPDVIGLDNEGAVQGS